ncbi:MAG TPA: hypothetical protein GYA10_15575 [Alphaproteobacteria bacterium]|nr:hypothetical protein [Alphaproteobacteria bacterium]
MPDPRAGPGSAEVDYLVDENGSPIDVPDDTVVRPARDDRAAVAATGPTNWWRRGLIALAIVVLILLLLQLFQGTPGTDVQPGTPTAAPAAGAAATPAPAPPQ